MFFQINLKTSAEKKTLTEWVLPKEINLYDKLQKRE